MLPFILRTVDAPSLQLQILSNDNLTLNVHIQTEMPINDEICPESDSAEFNRHSDNRAILREAKEAVYKAFTTFLKHTSEHVSFFPIELLSQYPCQRYTLILSVTRSYELQDVFQNTSDTIWMDGVNSIFEYEGYELAINAKHHIVDSSAFLVAPEKFTVFMRWDNVPDTLRFYRSSFIDITQNAPPPYHLNAQDVIETIQQYIVSRDSAMSLKKMRQYTASEEDSNETDTLAYCPECKGEIRGIGRSYFCLQCDWDDLPPLDRRR